MRARLLTSVVLASLLAVPARTQEAAGDSTDAADAMSVYAQDESAAADQDAQDAPSPAAVGVAVAARRLRAAADAYEFYRNAGDYLAPRTRALLRRRLPKAFHSRLDDRYRALNAIYSSLALIDWTAAPSCPSARAGRAALLRSDDGLFRDAAGKPTPWLQFILKSGGTQAADLEDAEQDADEAADAAGQYERSLARTRSLTDRCARASEYAALAAANVRPAADEDISEDEQDAEADADARPARPGALALYRRTATSVVFVRSASEGRPKDAAAGFVVGDAGNGTAVTRARAVVDPATGKPYDKIMVSFLPADFGYTLGADLRDAVPATVVSADMSLDLALLSFTTRPKTLRPLTLGDDSKVAPGDFLFALGHAEQAGWWSLTYGAAGGMVDWAGGVSGKDMFATSAGLSRGSFGGPVMTADGTVVGVILPTPARAPDGKPFLSPAFALRSSAVKRWLSYARDEDAGTVEETPVSQEAADFEEAASDQEIADLEVGQGSVLTVAQPYDLDAIVTAAEEDLAAQETQDAYAYADAEPAEAAPAEAESADTAAPPAPATPEERVRANAKKADSDLDAEAAKMSAATARDEAGDNEAEIEAGYGTTARAPAPAPRPAPAPAPRPAAPPPPPRPVQRPAPAPKPVPKPVLKPVPYTPRPSAPTRAPAPRPTAPRPTTPRPPDAAPPQPRPAPAPRPRPIPVPKPAPVPPAPRGIPPVPLRPLPRPAPPVAKAPPVAPKTAPRIAQLPGGQMGRLTPFSRPSSAGPAGAAPVTPVVNRPALQLPAVPRSAPQAAPRGAAATPMGITAGPLTTPGLPGGLTPMPGTILKPTTKEKPKDCRDTPCKPYAAGTRCYGPYHPDPHFPAPGPHHHFWTVNQNPVGCACHWNSGTKDVVSPPPPSTWVDGSGGEPNSCPPLYHD